MLIFPDMYNLFKMQAGMFNGRSGHTFLPVLITDFDLIWECNFFLKFSWDSYGREQRREGRMEEG